MLSSCHYVWSFWAYPSQFLLSHYAKNTPKNAYTHLLMNMYQMRSAYYKDLRELDNKGVLDVDLQVPSQFVDIEVKRVLRGTRWSVAIGEELVDDADARCLRVAVAVGDGVEVEDLDLVTRGGDDAALMPLLVIVPRNFYDICNSENVETIEKSKSRRDVEMYEKWWSILDDEG